MNSMMKYFKSQLVRTVHPGAVDKLWEKVIPQMCVDNDICPACSADLAPHYDMHSPYMHTRDRICTQCARVYKGGDVELIYRGRDTKPQAFIQKRTAGERA